MRKEKSFLLIPNHSIVIKGDFIYIEVAELDLLRVVRSKYTTIGITGFLTSKSITSLTGNVKISDVKLHKINDIEHAHSPLIKYFNYMRAIFIIPFIIGSYDFLYIFSPGYNGMLAAFWAKLLRKPYGIYIRGTWLDRKSRTPVWWRLMFREARFMIVTGEAFRHKLLEYCHNVENEIPLTAHKPYQIDINEITGRQINRILFAGRLNESKGVHDVVRAITVLKNQRFDVELLIAGGGTDEEIQELNKLQDKLGVQNTVTLLGHVDPIVLGEAYKRCGIFVLPSYYAEGFPRVLYEAMMYANAIVTCEMPGTEGFLIHEVNCLYCKPSDPGDLAACLRRLIQDEDYASKLGRTARADVERVYATFIDDSHAKQLLRKLG
ncbi:MAG: glycosyltransferase family 4 protein [Gammaproteobacteria bacterium]|nr:glycosyltransferase family 4 protein [Gammaproteobacteria bacterium]